MRGFCPWSAPQQHWKDTRAVKWSIAVGLFGGAVTLSRPDPVVWIVPALCALTWSRRSRQIWTLAGPAVPLGAFAIYALVAGIGRTFEDIVVSGLQLPAERRLLIPPQQSKALLLFFVLVAGGSPLAPAAGLRRMMTDRQDIRGRLLTAVGFVSLGLLPEMFRRDDLRHIAVAFLSVAFVPAALIDVTRDLRPPKLGVAVTAVAPVDVAFAGGAWGTGMLLEPYARPLASILNHPAGVVTVTNRGLTFIYPSSQSRAVEQIIATVEALTKPGQRLFVGSADLRRTPSNDNSIAVLLPELTDEMTFPDMHPGVALHHMAELAADLRVADVVVLTDAYAKWNESNESRLYGSETANQVVRALFCSGGTFDPYNVLIRCR